MAIALHHSQARTPTQRLILLGIANHDGDGGAWPSVATLSRYACGIDRSTVQRAIAELEGLGEIQRLVQAGGTTATPDEKRPNLYLFKLQCPEGCDRTKNHRVIHTGRVGAAGGVDAAGRGRVDAARTGLTNQTHTDISSSSPKRVRAVECHRTPLGFGHVDDSAGRCDMCGERA